MEPLWVVWVLSYFSVFWGSRNTIKKLRFFWSGSGRSREASGPNLTRLGTPKIGPGRVILGIFGVLFGGLVFKPFFHRFFALFSIVSTLSSYRYLQCFKHFSIFRNCRKMREKTHRKKQDKSMENRWKKPPKTITPTGASKKT